MLDLPFRPAGPDAIFSRTPSGLRPPPWGGGGNGGDFAGLLADLHSRATPSPGSGEQRKSTRSLGMQVPFKVEMISGGFMGPLRAPGAILTPS